MTGKMVKKEKKAKEVRRYNLLFLSLTVNQGGFSAKTQNTGAFCKKTIFCIIGGDSPKCVREGNPSVSKSACSLDGAENSSVCASCLVVGHCRC